jgi:5-methylthioribose kinase
MSRELDIEQPAQLLAYLRAEGHIAPDERPAIEVLAGGVSNRTVLLTRERGEAWVLKQALAKLRVRADWFSSPARIQREALGIRHLAALAPEATVGLIFEDQARHLLAMQAVPQPHRNWKTLLLQGELHAGAIRAFAAILARIQREAYARRAELAPIFAERSFFESLRVEPYYSYTASQQPASARFYTRLIADTRARLLTLTHGDYSPKNVLVRGEAVGAQLVYGARLVLLDHEVIHWGDPAFDLGFALTHLLSKAHHLAAQRAQFADAARLFWSHYRAELGELPWAEDLEVYAVRHTLGCLLARVDGRSPLEYLGEDERAWQRAAVLSLMGDPPVRVDALAERFVEALSPREPGANE